MIGRKPIEPRYSSSPIRWALIVLPAAAILALVGSSLAQFGGPFGGPPPPPPQGPVPADDATLGSKIDAAVKLGITYLVSQQRPDGSIVSGPAGNPGGAGGMTNVNAMTSLSIMAMAAVGHQPSDPTNEGRAMRKALEFMLKEGRQDITGYYGKSDGSRMYGHGITTLMLAEMLGMGVDEKMDKAIRERLAKAVDLIVAAQKAPKGDDRYRGGWRYDPTAQDADLSITVWQVMALRAARNAGLEMKAKEIDQAIGNAVGYIKRSYCSTRRPDGKPVNMNTGFSYVPGVYQLGVQAQDATFSTSAEGLLALQVCGGYDAPEVIGASDYLMAMRIPQNATWYYYGTYYFAQGMYQRGGKYEKQAATLVAQALLPKQDPKSGAWLLHGSDSSSGGPVYTTSMAILALSVKYHYLPIYQR